MTFAVSPAHGFVSLSPAGDSGTIVVDNAMISDHGVYALALTASQDSSSATHNISLDLQATCEIATILTSPATLSTMTAVMPAIGTEIQTFTITSDVTQAHPSIVCNFNAIMTPTAAFISLSPDF